MNFYRSTTIFEVPIQLDCNLGTNQDAAKSPHETNVRSETQWEVRMDGNPTEIKHILAT